MLCGDVTALCRDVTALCRDVTALCRDVTALCRDVTALCRDVTDLCRDVTALCRGVTAHIARARCVCALTHAEKLTAARTPARMSAQNPSALLERERGGRLRWL